jgi:4-hydroxyphenylpyruvate dioxygenase
MDVWSGFYARLFNFRQIRFFDIEGRAYRALFSRALTSARTARSGSRSTRAAGDSGPDRGISATAITGEGIQHIAMRRARTSMPRPIETLRARLACRSCRRRPTTYYRADRCRARAQGPWRGTRRAAAEQHGVLIDGEGVVDGGETKVLLQIFSANRDRADLLRIHPAEGRRWFRRGQFPRFVRMDRGGPGAPRRAEGRPRGVRTS